MIALRRSCKQNFKTWLSVPRLLFQGIKTNYATNLTKQDQSVIEIGNLVENMVNDFESSSCKQPCTQYQFETKLLYTQEMELEENQIKIVFDQTVDLTKTSFLMSLIDLLTGIGGAISFGRTLLWIIVIIIGLMKMLQKMKLID